MEGLHDIAARVRDSEEALRVLKVARGMVSDAKKREAIDKKIRAAEETLGRCSMRIAKLIEKRR
jgi:hypothetical protein